MDSITETRRVEGGSLSVADMVRDTIGRATLYLDSQQWEKWIELCEQDFEYTIKSWSPEINYDMTYLHSDREELQSLIRLLPKHNTDHSPLTRHTSIYVVDIDADGRHANAVSSVIVFQNMLDGTNAHIDSGESRLFLVGKYHDRFRIDQGSARFVSREVRLENRRLDKGSHWPI